MSEDALLHAVYLSSLPSATREFEAKPVEVINYKEHVQDFPKDADCFYYAKGPLGASFITEFTQVSGRFYVNAVLVPTIRLADYVASTQDHRGLESVLQSGSDTGFVVHSLHGYFYQFEEGYDRVVSASPQTIEEVLTVIEGTPPVDTRLFLMVIDGERYWLPLRRAGIVYDSGYQQVEIGGAVLVGAGKERPITTRERSRITEIAEDYSASK